VAPTVRENLKAIRDRAARAAAKAGTPPDRIRIVAVTKTLAQEAVNEAVEAGATDIGENYVQEAAEKIKGFAGSVRPTWHMIGHLQTNKAKAAVELFDLIQTVDSTKLAREIDKRAEQAGKRQDILVELHVTDEATKFGANPEELSSLVDYIISGLLNVRLRGIMGMAPFVSDPEQTRPYFAKLRAAFEGLPPENRELLSMGMTQDYEVAIEEGSNMVRIGTAIFGPRR
jgi:pyridoxal phosphate enzyme (YggS family)